MADSSQDDEIDKFLDEEPQNNKKPSKDVN